MGNQLGFNFNFQPNKDRDITLLVGICNGISADGVLTDGEISFLRTWLTEHTNIHGQWPAEQIQERLALVMRDGVIASSERTDLLELISRVARNEFAETGSSGIANAEYSLIPNDLVIEAPERSFCFTGNFAYGTKEVCHFVMKRLGAEVHRDITQKTDYLIVGAGHNPDWKHGAFGTKIERAQRWRTKNGVPKIIHEPNWIAWTKSVANERGINELRAGFRNSKRREPTVIFNSEASGGRVAAGWFFQVYEAFRPALDICFIQSDKKSGWEEGDPPVYRFNDHDQFVSSNGETFIAHINQAGEDKIGEFGEIIRGKVFVEIFKMTNGTYQSLEEISCSNIELVKLLRFGKSEHINLVDSI